MATCMHTTDSNRTHAEARADRSGKANAEGSRALLMFKFISPAGTCGCYAMGNANATAGRWRGQVEVERAGPVDRVGGSGGGAGAGDRGLVEVARLRATLVGPQLRATLVGSQLRASLVVVGTAASITARRVFWRSASSERGAAHTAARPPSMFRRSSAVRLCLGARPMAFRSGSV